MKPTLSLLGILACLGLVGNLDYADALEREAQAKALPYRPHDPYVAPRCPPVNARGEVLRVSLAERPDDRAYWIVDCRYGI